MSVTNFYDYQGVENDYTSVTEKDIMDLMFNVFKEYTESDRYTETKRLASAMVESIEQSYQDLLDLSHKSSYFNSDICKTKEIIDFNIKNDRFMSPEELQTREDNLERADDLIAGQMVPIMDSLNKKFEQYEMKCRFTDLSDFAVVRDQALDMEEAILNKGMENSNYSDFTIKQLMSHKTQEKQDDKQIIDAAEKAREKVEGKFERYAENRGYNDRNSYETIQNGIKEKAKEAGLDFEEYHNPNFAKDDNETVYSC